jgi:type II secretory pathway component PulF
VPSEDVALLEAGEATGNLDKTLDRVAARHDARRDARRRFLTDTWYPLILFHAAALLIPLVPAFMKDKKLLGPSWITGVLTVLVPFYALLGGVLWLQRTARGRAAIRRVVDVIPGFGNASRHRRRADFADVLGAAYEAGVQLDRALALAGASVEEPRLGLAATVVGRGSTLKDALATAGFLPLPILNRIGIGEQAGEIGKVLGEVSHEEAEAAEHIFRRSMTLLSKIVYLGVALWIVIYVVSFYMRLYAPFLK